MRRLIIIGLALSLAACSQRYTPLTNDQIIAEVKKCEEAGLDAEEVRVNWAYIVHIQCVPRGGSK